MKISALVLHIAITTLADSVKIVDNGRIFQINDEAREEAWKVLVNLLNNLAVDIQIVDEETSD